jgi:hypothetical protein
MKKILLQIIFLLLVLLNFSKAQTSTPFNYSQSNPITVGGLFDTLFDKEGNKYDIKKLFINDSLRESFDNSKS